MSDSSNPTIFLTGEKLNLVLMDTARHLPNALRWINSPELRDLLGSGEMPVTRADEEQYFSNLATGNPHKLHLAIETKDGQHIGTISALTVRYAERFCWRMGAMIGEPEYWGKGYGREAEALVRDYIFGTLGARRLEAEIFAFNERSLRCALAVGLREEGRRRDAIHRRGQWHDIIMLGLLRSEWEALVAAK